MIMIANIEITIWTGTQTKTQSHYHKLTKRLV